MILVDTSAWVEYDRATGSPAHRRVRGLIDRPTEIAVTEPVIAEIAAGAWDDQREHALRSLLDRFELLPFDSPADFDNAATICRRCRRSGITPRGLIDCLIVSVALRFDVPVLAHDADLARIADVTPLRLDRASLRPA